MPDDEQTDEENIDFYLGGYPSLKRMPFRKTSCKTILSLLSFDAAKLFHEENAL